MAKWKVEGVDRETGENRDALVYADTKKGAIGQAADRGIMIADLWEEEDDRLAVSPARPPDYLAMLTVSVFIRVLGWMAVAGTAISFFATLVLTDNDGTGDWLAFLIILFGALIGLAVALVFFAIAESVAALRDIAINSWKIPGVEKPLDFPPNPASLIPSPARPTHKVGHVNRSRT